MAEDVQVLGPTSHYFYSQRLKLHYVDWGNAERRPLLLLHGGRDHCRSWDWVAADLRRDFHLIAADLRGHGDSAWAVGSTYSMIDYVLDLAALLKTLDLFPITIIGHSLGARDLEPHHLPGAAGARQGVVGARPGSRGARRRLPPSAHHDRRAGGTLGPPRPARRLPARGAPVPRGAVSGRLRPALVLGILCAGCGASPDTRIELRAYLARTKSWA